MNLYKDRLAFSVEEVAERLNLKVRAVRKLIKGGSLYAIQVGRKQIVPVWALKEFLSRQ
ncbi:excisionase family DNA binding protein [Deinococcus sp. HSC-46F16]|uniref:helix-turn-helix domain-containing protein n=1 Tax=Deinococcus sp. HSC-46F16 TaxID=2910968 RepID=UPI00209C92C8|nr:excisionase family DNA binding protein [Deinococcus sp. HSC-46F16]